MLTAEVIARFWTKVRKTPGCWLWLAAKYRRGYGQFMRAGAHRASWQITNGPIPDNLFVLHRCDNPSCVRPDHLFLGTQLDNMRDCQQKGRYVKRRLRKLTDESVRVIRASYQRGNGRALAARFGVSQAAISMIVSGARCGEVR